MAENTLVVYSASWQNPKPIERFALGKSPQIDKKIDFFFSAYGDYICIKMSVNFASVAAKYTPPCIGRNIIQQKYYYRPIQDLTLLVKGEYPPYHATKADYAALRAGYKFRVLNTKQGHKRNEVHAYTKGINEAKRASRIERRGLSKYSWGSMLNNSKEDMVNLKSRQSFKAGEKSNLTIYRIPKLPPIFQRLSKKSPDIVKYQWGTFDWQYNSNNVQNIRLTVVNRLVQIQRYANIAIRNGQRAAEKTFNSIIKNLGAIAANTVEGGYYLGDDQDKNQQVLEAREFRQQLIETFNDIGNNLQMATFKKGRGRPPENATIVFKLFDDNGVITV